MDLRPYEPADRHVVYRRHERHCTSRIGTPKRYRIRVHEALWIAPYLERHEEIVSAIQREKAIKDWPRAWKVRLIRGQNPDWDDLYDPFAH
jgi:predicted GIY-YIG superfamily endonuclease